MLTVRISFMMVLAGADSRNSRTRAMVAGTTDLHPGQTSRGRTAVPHAVPHAAIMVSRPRSVQLFWFCFTVFKGNYQNITLGNGKFQNISGVFPGLAQGEDTSEVWIVMTRL